MKDMMDEGFLLEKMQHGKDATNLINNEVWRVIISELQKDALDAFWELANVEPTDPAAITKLQNKVHRYTEMVLKLDLVVQQAAAAYTIKEEELLDD